MLLLLSYPLSRTQMVLGKFSASLPFWPLQPCSAMAQRPSH